MIKNPKTILCLAAVTTYSFLFYEQTAGINFLLFTIFLILFFAVIYKDVWKFTSWKYAAGASLLSAGSLVWHHSDLALVSNILSLVLLAGFSIRPTVSLLISFFQTIYSIITSPVKKLIDYLISTTDEKSVSKSKFRLAIYVVPVLITLAFFLLYQNSNPLFADFISKINLNFVSWPWIVFTIGGFLLLFGTFFPETYAPFTQFDESQPDQMVRNRKSVKDQIMKFLALKTELQKGKILLFLLNILLLFVNGLDFLYLIILKQLPKGVNNTEFLHQSVHSLIFSIILAIAVILYYFRGNLNFFKKNESLKLLAYIWIFQNAILVLITLFKNWQYVESFGLTHRRIGVYAYLLLTFIGLGTTFWKVIEAKSNWFLVKINSWLFFMVLVMSTFFNWDSIITEFNLNHIGKISTDYSYLLDLSDSNLPELLTMTKNEKYQFSDEQRNQIFGKKHLFLEKILNQDWQSWNYDDKRVLDEINAQPK